MNKRLVSLAYVLALFLVVVPGSVFGTVARGVMVVLSLAAIGSLASSGWKIKWVEFHWALLGALYVVGGLFSALFSPRMELGLLDAGRQLFIFIFALSALIFFRDPDVGERFRRMLVWPALMGAGTLIFGFLVILGVPTLEKLSELASFKFEMDARFGVNPNPLSFAIVLLFVLSWQEAGKSRSWWFLGYASIILVSVVLSGARTSLFIIPIALLVVRMLNRRPSALALALLALMALVALILSTFLVGDLSLSDAIFAFSELTTGRSDLWGAALAKFVERPLLGWGAHTWDLDLSSYLSIFSTDVDRFELLESGGFHNAYLTQLAEKGIFGLALELVVLGYVMRSSLRLYWMRSILQGEDRRIAVIAPVWVVLLAIRGFSEVGGLLGYANAGVDFIAYVGAGLILAAYGRISAKYSVRAR